MLHGHQPLAGIYGYAPVPHQHLAHAEYAQGQLLAPEWLLQVGGELDPVHLFA
jgi:hypothetical protein